MKLLIFGERGKGLSYRRYRLRRRPGRQNSYAVHVSAGHVRHFEGFVLDALKEAFEDLRIDLRKGIQFRKVWAAFQGAIGTKHIVIVEGVTIPVLTSCGSTTPR